MILIDTQKEEFTKLKDIRIFEKLDNEQRYNGDLLVIGLGGMGSQVVCDMKGMLMGEITPDDNIQYLMVDSDIPAMENMIEASRDGIGLNATEIISIYRPNLENLLVRGIRRIRCIRILRIGCVRTSHRSTLIRMEPRATVRLDD